MTEETTQTVVDTTAAVAEPTAPDANAQGNELEALLNDYETATKTQTPPVQQQTTTAFDPVVAELKAKVDSWERKSSQEDYGNLIKKLGSGHSLPDEVAEGFITKQVRENPKLNDVYNNRYADPTSWNRTEAALIKGYGAYVKKAFSKMPDAEATADRAAVAAAVRGASTTAPVSKPPNLGAMTDYEFNQYLRDNGLR